jgi:carboxymethylenebutenolidase
MQTSEMMAIRTKDGGTMNCYVAKPDKEPAPAVIIIQEIFGITNWLKSTAEWLASQGYFGVVPDLFWRLEPNLVLNDRDQAQLQKAFGLYGKFDQSQGVEDLKDTMKHLKEHRSINGKVGTIGYCLGGLMSYFMACRSDADCAVSYYGGGIDSHLDEGKNIKKPTILHLAGADAYIDATAQEKIKSGLSHNPNVSVHIYPNTGHAFCRVGGEHYDKSAADLANSRTADFFKQHLR